MEVLSGVCAQHSRIEAILKSNKEAIERITELLHEMVERSVRLEELIKNQGKVIEEVVTLRKEIEEKTDRIHGELLQRVDTLERKISRFEGALGLLKVLLGLLTAVAGSGLVLSIKIILGG